ncbi:hypothetical protein ACTFIZ_008814 [Dictyostelium cf. discoideum]
MSQSSDKTINDIIGFIDKSSPKILSTKVTKEEIKYYVSYVNNAIEYLQNLIVSTKEENFELNKKYMELSKEKDKLENIIKEINKTKTDKELNNNKNINNNNKNNDNDNDNNKINDDNDDNNNNNKNNPNDPCPYIPILCLLKEYGNNLTDIQSKILYIFNIFSKENKKINPTQNNISQNQKITKNIFYFSKNKSNFNMLKFYFNKNNQNNTILNLKMENPTDDPIKPNTCSIYVITSTSSRINFNYYKDDIEQLSNKTNLIILFLIMGNYSKPIANIEGFNGDFISLQYFSDSILDSEQNNQQFSLLLNKIFSNKN